MVSQAAKNAREKTHGGYGGRTLIQRIEAQMDKRRKVMERMVVENGMPNDLPPDQRREYYTNNGRYEGLAAALAILRSSSVPHEISRSNERLGIE